MKIFKMILESCPERWKNVISDSVFLAVLDDDWGNINVMDLRNMREQMVGDLKNK